MFTDDDYLPSPRPFWFASEELWTDILRAEIDTVNKLLARYPNLPDIFDAPDATIPQRTACFELLAHRELMDIVYEMFAGFHQQSPSLGESESKALRGTQNLVARDAPPWAREVKDVVELLSYRVNDALPKPLRKGRYDANDPAQSAAIKSLITIEKIQSFTTQVLDEQLKRLERRWSAIPTTIVEVREPNKWRPNKRKGWEQREKLYRAIRKVLTHNPSLHGIKFCAELDKRHAPPLYDWTKSGEWREWFTWKDAWSNRQLRDKIRRVRQEAMKSR
jgi:hypothetical protein